MNTNDFGDFRLYSGRNYCGARYSILKDGTQITFNVEGKNSDDVSEVALKSLSAIWDDIGNPFNKLSHSEEKKLMEKASDKMGKYIHTQSKMDFFLVTIKQISLEQNGLPEH